MARRSATGSDRGVVRSARKLHRRGPVLRATTDGVLDVAITGIESLTYRVADLAASRRFFEDFGLQPAAAPDGRIRFELPEGSSVLLMEDGDPLLPTSELVGAGVCEVVWGVSSADELERLATDLSRDRDVRRDNDGSAHFLTDFGIAMGLRVFSRKPVVCAPEPVNAPGRVLRLNQHRRWRRRAYPKGISHVVFAVPGFDTCHLFMTGRLGFRVTDEQVGFGWYLRADGTTNHHNLLLLNAHAPLPDMDGELRFHHANYAVEDLDEMMVGANHMQRRGWEPSHFGLGRHRVDSALFYYLPCPAGGEAEYGADADCVDDAWVPRRWPEPLFAYAHFVHNLPPFLRTPPDWRIEYPSDELEVAVGTEGAH